MKGRLIKAYNNSWYVCNEQINLQVIDSETITNDDEGKLVECKVITKLIYDNLKHRSIEVPYYAQITHYLSNNDGEIDTPMLRKLKNHINSISPQKFEEEMLDIIKLENNLNEALNIETKETLEEWINNKRKKEELGFSFVCDVDNCPHCAKDIRQINEHELMADDLDIILDFGEWLLSYNIFFSDNTEKGNVYCFEGIKYTIKELFNLYLKEN